MSEQVFQTRYETYRTAVESYLETLFAGRPDWRDLYESMRYSLLAGGKRIRPVLTLEFARLAGLADWKTALPMACALELVHTYSLIHDDLPCMDNDDLRRGKPTNHKVYGETLAVLAGDALQPEAYRLILTAPGLDESRRAACGRILAEVSGADGMVAGQVLDTLHAPKTEAEVTEVHRLKTGAMIAGACRLGVAAAGGWPPPKRTPRSWGWPSRSGTTCWTCAATRRSSASPSAPTKRRGRSPSWTCWGWRAAAGRSAPIRRRPRPRWRTGTRTASWPPWRTPWRSGTSEERGRRPAAPFLSGAGDCPHQEDSPAGHKKFTDAYTEYVVYLLDL